MGLPVLSRIQETGSDKRGISSQRDKMPIIIELQPDHVFGKETIPLERNRPTIKGRPLLNALNIICFFEEISNLVKFANTPIRQHSFYEFVLIALMIIFAVSKNTIAPWKSQN